MKTCHLLPPYEGLNADPLLFGVAAGVAQLFPLPPEMNLDQVLQTGSQADDPRGIEQNDAGGERER